MVGQGEAGMKAKSAGMRAGAYIILRKNSFYGIFEGKK
jgi:hypothetical protein